ncbi:hypothetical protein D3C80_1040510 [compost metagenome]
MQAFGQTSQINLGIAGQGDVQVGMAAFVDQLQADTRLLHLTGLTHLGVVETHEGRRLGGVAEGELLGLLQGCTQAVDQRLERRGLAV